MDAAQQVRHNRLVIGWLVAVALAVSGGQELQLADEARELFHLSVEDPAPRIRGGMSEQLAPVHYLASNEWKLEGFRSHVEGLGGGYVGVGSDQAYLFIAWQRPDFAWLVDYDTAVVATHRVYAALFTAAPSPTAFARLLHPDSLSHAVDAVTTMYEKPRARRLSAFLRRNRKYLWQRIARLQKEHRRAGVASYLTDQELYDAVRDRIVAGRVRPMVANLQDSVALRGIATAAEQLGVPIRTVYLSNAEEYWDNYSASFVDNLLALPVDQRSIVLRTRVLAPVRDYEYFVGGLEDFRSALCVPEGVSPLLAMGPYEHPPRDSDRVVLVPAP